MHLFASSAPIPDCLRAHTGPTRDLPIGQAGLGVQNGQDGVALRGIGLPSSLDAGLLRHLIHLPQDGEVHFKTV